MDGNGRWAERRGLPRTAGHRAGAKAVERIVEAAPAAGISTLTLYAFSSDNWSGPMPEVAALMRLFRSYLKSRRGRALENGVAIEVIGRRDRLAASVLREMGETAAATAGGTLLRSGSRWITRPATPSSGPRSGPPKSGTSTGTGLAACWPKWTMGGPTCRRWIC